MKSATSFFHKGIAANLLRRCWPVWACYLALLLLLGPIVLFSSIRTHIGADMPLAMWMRRDMLESGRLLMLLSFFVGILVVMVVFSFLYNARTCGMMNALPVRRVTVFSTVWLTGLLPLLVADLLTALIMLLCFSETLTPTDVGTWFALVAMGNICFYGFSSFCAMLTGSLYILPLVYAVLNATVVVVEASVRALLDALLYGGDLGGYTLTWLSPVLYLMEKVMVITDGHQDEAGRWIYEAVSLRGLGALAAYCAAGLVFALFALLLYRRRRMESASDAVAVPVLKPVFKYCMAFGCALVLSVALWRLSLAGVVRGRAVAPVIALLMLLGAFIGYFAALMLMKKSMKVFRGAWKGFAVTAAVCLVFVAAAELDLAGFETRQPDPDQVAAVHLNVRQGYLLTEKQNIQESLRLHQTILSQKERNESARETYRVEMIWDLKNGKHVSRAYELAFAPQDIDDPDSSFRRFLGLTDTVEANLYVFGSSIPVTPETVYHVEVWNNWDEKEENRHPEIPVQLRLSPEEAAALYQECILPDILAGRIHDTWLEELQGKDASSGIYLNMDLRLPRTDAPLSPFGRREDWDSIYFSLPESAELTLARLAELSLDR